MKKHTPDNIGEVAFTTSNSALLLWRTQMLDYLFANHLNQCYHLRLWRDQDLSLSQFIPALSSLPQCPMWYYFDASSKIFYVLIDISGCRQQMGEPLAYYDKLLFLYGRDCWTLMSNIYNDFTTKPSDPNPHDLLQLQYQHLLSPLRNAVEKVDYYDARNVFVSDDTMVTDRNSDAYNTSLLTAVPHPYSQKLRRSMAIFNDLLLDILAAVEINLQSMEV